MELFFGVMVGLLILVLLVVLHELGHGIVARRNGVDVEEFGVGFPPKAYGKKIKKSILGKNVLFTLNWLPLGGFVRLKGENDSAAEKGDYGAASYWVKTKILLAGVLMNWLTAAVLFSIIALFGLPKVLPDQFYIPQDATIVSKPLEVTVVSDDSPAKYAGLERRDTLLRFNDTELDSANTLTKLTRENKGERVDITYVRDGKEATTQVTLRESNDDRKGYLGVGSTQRQEIKATWSAPIVGAGTTVQFTWLTFKGTGEAAFNFARGLVKSVSPNEQTRQSGNQDVETVGDSVAGPIGILGVIFPSAQQAGIKTLLFLSAIISLSLAVVNFLPIPALDGGRWFTMTYYRLRKKELTKEREEKIQTIGFMFLIGLILLVTFADVGKFL